MSDTKCRHGYTVGICSLCKDEDLRNRAALCDEALEYLRGLVRLGGELRDATVLAGALDDARALLERADREEDTRA